ncbi:MAG: glycoside hydrolase, partial [Planctomycetia bacterium]|nr:glycoside hydrolase [Planctomycetia bacterium]
VTTKGTLLAMAEGRARLKDIAENDLVLKRSTDGGRTWGPLIVVAEDGDNSLNNPLLVVVRPSGRILLMYQRYPAHTGEAKVVAGLDGNKICRTLLQQSDDDGLTWSAPREITASVKRPTKVTSVASGPGIGIQLQRGEHRGRIVMPFNQGPTGDWRVYAVLSDDGGKTWRYGDIAPEDGRGHANEVQMVELADGSIRLNARAEPKAGRRKTAVSRDGGQTWSKLESVDELIDPRCMGSTIRYGELPEKAVAGERSRLLFSNPADAQHRLRGTVRLSYDEGRTWPVARVLEPGSFAYSCLASLPDGTIGCLYEGDNYRKIIFARFTLDWLTAESPANQPAGKTPSPTPTKDRAP